MHAIQSSRSVRAASMFFFALGLSAATLGAQSFGRNKVQYDRLDFRILPTEHFDLFYYQPADVGARDAAHMAERWYERHSALLGFSFSGNPLILYADPPDFQQSNVIEGLIGEGTGGVTEGAQDRVIMPLTGVYANTDHVLGHELVHVFQYRIASSSMGGINNIERIPLWLIEGMAEYLSLGRYDSNTAMWLRDAALRNDLPTINQLTTDPKYFPYRYGQALWAYIGGRWGDQMVNRLFRAAVRSGWEGALRSQLGMNGDSLSKVWHAAIRTQYAEALTRTAPGAVGRGVINVADNGDQNVAPAVSPDGRMLAFFSSRNLFGIDLYVADMATGHVERQLTSVTRNGHFDALSFISSSGSWSNDARRIAIVVNAQGNEEVDVLDARSGDVQKRVHVAGVGSITDPAWSPDGRYLAFSGLHGGISDIYLHDLESGATRQLTNDREAQLQPSWSPDGRTLAFTTDAGPATRFDVLSYGPMRLALLDIASGQVRLLPAMPNGKAINPQWAPDGLALFFVSDNDGVNDIYRLTVASGAVDRITRISTGVSGITGLSPTLSVARTTGDLVFSVFDRGGFAIRSIAAADIRGTPITTVANNPVAGVLPPAVPLATDLVQQTLTTPNVGLTNTVATETRPYRPNLTLNSVGSVGIGATLGSGYGTGVSGGASFGFSDMLGNHILNTTVQLNGSLIDAGAQLLYLNRARRLTWGGYVSHTALVGAAAEYSDANFQDGTTNVAGTVVAQYIQRELVDDVRGVLQFPLSATRRLEFDAGVQHIGFRSEVDSLFVVGTQVVNESKGRFPAGSPLTLGTAALAYVGDYSFFGFTSPIAGGRYRFEASPSIGSLQMTTALADYRRYFFRQPFSLAMRALHFGRYGKDAETSLLQPIYLGDPMLVRGYGANDFNVSECSSVAGNGSTSQSGCPEFDRLNGSRIAVASMELRIPLLGSDRLGLIRFPYLPTEIAPFVDAGVAWNAGDSPVFKFAERTTERVPVFSAGITARFNLFGYAVIEAFYAHPFQRPGRGNHFGFQLAPGW